MTSTEALGALREWQHDGPPIQLHPGDLGWFQRFGAEAAAAALRTWRRDGRILAVGLLDGPDVLRLAIAPDARQDEELARQLVADAPGTVEAPADALVRELLTAAGWVTADPWTPLHRDLTAPVEDPGIRVEVAGPGLASVRAAVQRASFPNSTFTEERWHAMAAGPAYADARCLVAYSGGDAVAAATVWSAGPGRPGLLEPLGVHHDHRGQGHGRALSIAAAAVLRDLGSSSAAVCTPSSNVAAVATYTSAGYRPGPAVQDLKRVAAG
jgi:GNAT superfamily N-acetyltransferase